MTDDIDSLPALLHKYTCKTKAYKDFELMKELNGEMCLRQFLNQQCDSSQTNSQNNTFNASKNIILFLYYSGLFEKL